jgi:hypothetical protein
MLPGLVLSIELVRNMHWKGRLIVIAVVKAVHLTNCPKLLSNFAIAHKRSTFTRRTNGPSSGTFRERKDPREKFNFYFGFFVGKVCQCAVYDKKKQLFC